MEEPRDKPFIISGARAKDTRGSVSFVNAFTFPNVKRFYVVENSPKNPIRAFHGHFKETKYVFAVTGLALLVLVALDNANTPNKRCRVYRYVLRSQKPEIVYVPPGFANGFKALERQTKVIFFSTASVEESEADDHRYPYDYWGKGLWETSSDG